MREVVIAAIFSEKGLLVGQRCSDPFKGYWECPGGKVEDQESLIEALIREIDEEGQVKVLSAQSMFDYEVSTLQGQLHLTWFYTIIEGPFKPLIYDKIRFIKKEELHQIDWIPHNLPYIDHLKDYFFIQS
jgi:8-oxo-dGTP diphosphatase